MREEANEVCSRPARIGRSVVRRIVLAGLLALGTGPATAEEKTDPARIGLPGRQGMSSFRVEFGGYNHWVDRDLGEWRGWNGELWLGRRSRFTAGILLDSQSRPSGTQQNYAFTSYMNWTPSFYTIQSISGAPQRSGGPIYFPEIRYDLRLNWKLPPEKRFILGAGLTHFDLGGSAKGDILNLGSVYYFRDKVVLVGDLFLNRSRPGNLMSASGSMSLQYGTEGAYWLGLTVGGGRELYRIELRTPLDVRLDGYTVDVFYRRWLTRHFGFLVTGTFQEKLEAYRRGGVSGRVFFDF